MRSRFKPIALALVLGTFQLPLAQADNLPSGSAFTDNATGFVKGFGLGFMHRAFEPATSLDGGGAVFLEVNLMQFPTDIINAMQSVGGSFPPGGVNIFPSLKLHVHKGLIHGIDLDLSGFYLPAISPNPLYLVNVGGNVQWVVWEQPEGPTVAVRLNYTYGYYQLTIPTPLNNVDFGPPIGTVSIPDARFQGTFTTNVWSPQVLISRNLGFFDPYIGAGLEYTWGGVNATEFTGLASPAPPSFDLGSAFGGGWSYRLLVGIKFAVPGFRLGFEGSFGSSFTNNYYNGESSSLGVAIGLNY